MPGIPTRGTSTSQLQCAVKEYATLRLCTETVVFLVLAVEQNVPALDRLPGAKVRAPAVFAVLISGVLLSSPCWWLLFAAFNT